jgi:hypothetical protein
MSATPALGYGRLEIDYNAYGHDHVARWWVRAFSEDAGVGTFVVPTTPVSLDALATHLSGMMKPLFSTSSSLAFGAWHGIRTVNTVTGHGIVAVEGTVTPGSGTLDATVNVPLAVSQMTATFRDDNSHLVKHTFLGATYYGFVPFVYSSIGGAHKVYADYIFASNVIISRNGVPITSLIHMTFDTNDGLTRTYRR